MNKILQGSYGVFNCPEIADEFTVFIRLIDKSDSIILAKSTS